MVRYIEGDANGFRVLSERYGQSIFAFIISRVGDPATAEDLVQDVFMRVVRSASQFRGHASVRTWLYTIARNLCIDHSRKMVHRRKVTLDEPINRGDGPSATIISTAPASGPGADESLDAQRQLDRIQKALLALPEDQRDVFILRQRQGMKFREIAELLGESENTIKSRMRYALTFLREALGREQSEA